MSTTAKPVSPGAPVWRRASTGACLLVLAALAVGLAYNQLSPLGVRLAPSAGAVAREPKVTRVEGSPYAGQNYGLAWIGGGGSQAPASPVAPVAHPPGADSVALVPWAELKPVVERQGALLVDARPFSHYVAGHIPGAVSLPLGASETELATFAAAHARTRALVVYCANAECPMADRLAHQLVERLGFRNVKVLAGGLAAYRQAEARAGNAPVVVEDKEAP